MTVSRGAAFVLLGSLLSCAALALDQKDEDIGSAPATVAQQEPPTTKPVNLKALPQDIPVTTLNRLMKRYGRELGVECNYCHVENRDTGKLDYISDDNPKKETTRTMIAMLEDINDRHLAQLGGDQRYSSDVSCGTCHQGRANPPAWEARRR